MDDFHCNVKSILTITDPLCHVTMLTCVGITGHWIDANFTLQQELPGFVPLSSSHTGAYMAEIVYDQRIWNQIFFSVSPPATRATTFSWSKN